MALVSIAQDAIGKDSFATEVFDRLIAKNVAAHFGDQCHVGAKAGGGYRLVGAFAAGGHDELSARDGFAGPGQSAALDHHVGIHAANDNDSRRFHVKRSLPQLHR